MRNIKRRVLPLLAVLLVLVAGLTVTASAAGDPTEEVGTKWVECGQCGGIGGCTTCLGLDPECEDCGGTFTCSACDGRGYVL